MGSFKFIQTDKGLLFKLAKLFCVASTKYGKQHTPRAQSPWLCCFPDKRTRSPRHVTLPTCTVWSISEILKSRALLPRRPRALLPWQPADSRPGSMAAQDTRLFPSRADRSAVRTSCCSSSRRSNCCQKSDLSLERPLVHTRLRRTTVITITYF